MMQNFELWALTRQAWLAIVEQYDPVLDRFREQNWLETWSAGLLFAALTFEPQAISAARLAVRGPYIADETYRSRLAALAERGFLAEAYPGEYRLTTQGRADIEALIQEAYNAMAKADPLSAEEGVALGDLLDRLAQASLNTPPPPDTWSIALAYKLMPPRQPPLPFIEQAISCLNGYRDDAHLAAWRPSGISPTAMESLTLLWRGEADSLDALFERLASRGHPREAYAQALDELRQDGYLTDEADHPRLTPAGQAFRQQVEQATDHYFYTPWDVLEEDEMEQLARLLARLRDGLKPDNL